MAHDIFESIHKGLEGSDLNALMSVYDDNAELELIDHDHPPSLPRLISGKEEIAEYFKAILDRPRSHHVEDEVMGDSHLAFTDSCEYPDGTRVFTSSMATLKKGRIVREVNVQAWDEASPYVKFEDTV